MNLHQDLRNKWEVPQAWPLVLDQVSTSLTLDVDASLFELHNSLATSSAHGMVAQSQSP